MNKDQNCETTSTTPASAVEVKNLPDPKVVAGASASHPSTAGERPGKHEPAVVKGESLESLVKTLLARVKERNPFFYYPAAFLCILAIAFVVYVLPLITSQNKLVGAVVIQAEGSTTPFVPGCFSGVSTTNDVTKGVLGFGWQRTFGAVPAMRVRVPERGFAVVTRPDDANFLVMQIDAARTDRLLTLTTKELTPIWSKPVDVVPLRPSEKRLDQWQLKPVDSAVIKVGNRTCLASLWIQTNGCTSLVDVRDYLDGSQICQLRWNGFCNALREQNGTLHVFGVFNHLGSDRQVNSRVSVVTLDAARMIGWALASKAKPAPAMFLTPPAACCEVLNYPFVGNSFDTTASMILEPGWDLSGPFTMSETTGEYRIDVKAPDGSVAKLVFDKATKNAWIIPANGTPPPPSSTVRTFHTGKTPS